MFDLLGETVTSYLQTFIDDLSRPPIYRMRHPFILTRTTKIKITSVGKDVEKLYLSALLMEMSNGAPTMETSLKVPQNSSTWSPCDPAIPFLGLSPREQKTNVYTKT